jgi:hypothetical protein
MKTLNELYLILWDNIKDKNYINGLCNEINKLYFADIISYYERQLLRNHFKSQKPDENQHSKFLKNPTWLGDNFWWKDEEDTNPINRKKFIQKMIKITKP